MIPLYGFLEGDTVGLLILVDRTAAVGTIATKLRQAAAVRVADDPQKRVVLLNGRPLDSTLTVARAGLQPLDLVRVVKEAA